MPISHINTQGACQLAVLILQQHANRQHVSNLNNWNTARNDDEIRKQYFLACCCLFFVICPVIALLLEMFALKSFHHLADFSLNSM
jgi:hypothetical protein